MRFVSSRWRSTRYRSPVTIRATTSWWRRRRRWRWRRCSTFGAWSASSTAAAIRPRAGGPTVGCRRCGGGSCSGGRMGLGREPWSKVDRLLLGALVEARSCERFTRLLAVVEDAEVARLLNDLGPAEQRHREGFYALAGPDVPSDRLAARRRGWLGAGGRA